MLPKNYPGHSHFVAELSVWFYFINQVSLSYLETVTSSTLLTSASSLVTHSIPFPSAPLQRAHLEVENDFQFRDIIIFK